jgi:hypothetical protein
MALVKYNNNSISAVTSASSIPSGALTHIKTLTASSSATLSFVDGSSDVVLDSTYPIYKFSFINMHPGTHDVLFMMNLSTDGGSNYNVAKTTTLFFATHGEDGSGGALTYYGAKDLAQGTGYQTISLHPGAENDESCSGELWLYNPSSTTFVKHFMSTFNTYYHGDKTYNTFCAGYGNTTSAVNAISFKMESGNIDSGKIKLYGIKDS